MTQSLITTLHYKGRKIIIVPLWVILLRCPEYAEWPPRLLRDVVNGRR